MYCYGNQACYGATILAKRYVYGYGYKGLESAKVKAWNVHLFGHYAGKKTLKYPITLRNKKLIVISTGFSAGQNSNIYCTGIGCVVHCMFNGCDGI